MPVPVPYSFAVVEAAGHFGAATRVFSRHPTATSALRACRHSAHYRVIQGDHFELGQRIFERDIGRVYHVVEQNSTLEKMRLL